MSRSSAIRTRESSLSLVQVRPVSSVTLNTSPLGPHAVDAHSADADDQVFVLVELHAERTAADMGEHLALLETLAGEADDVAVARRAVETILAIEDDVFGTFDLIEADRLCTDQPVVLRKWRTGCPRLIDGAGDKRQHGRIDVDLLDDLAAVLGPFDVDADGDEKNDAGDRGGDVAGNADADEAVRQHEDDDRADHRPPDRAAPADTDAPPTMTAVSAWNSQPTPVVESVLPWRAA